MILNGPHKWFNWPESSNLLKKWSCFHLNLCMVLNKTEESHALGAASQSESTIIWASITPLNNTKIWIQSRLWLYFLPGKSWTVYPGCHRASSEACCHIRLTLLSASVIDQTCLGKLRGSIGFFTIPWMVLAYSIQKVLDVISSNLQHYTNIAEDYDHLYWITQQRD